MKHSEKGNPVKYATHFTGQEGKGEFWNMIRVTFINGSYYCEPGKTLLKLKRDSWDRTIGVTRKTERRRLRANEIVTFMSIYEDVYGKWIKVRTSNYQIYEVKPEDLIYQKEHLREKG